ncbi:MAG: lysophospholipid acyltransferase family protein [Rhodocyclaceae bacterium]|nr:lysophospholipid acyltransferase family protein [Rhodocyclaceae bacterium]
MEKCKNVAEPGGRGIWAWICVSLLRLAGWRLEYQPPPGPKALAIFYPHTSNWDFVLAMLAKGALGLPLRWAGKDSLFRGIFGAFFRALGGVPVNRRERTGFVGQMAEQFRRNPVFYLGMAPEGTRSLTEGWKSGFYHLALAAGVPLALTFLDFRRREVGVRAYFRLTGDETRDMAAIAAVYAGVTGKHPELQSPIRLLSRTETQKPANVTRASR